MTLGELRSYLADCTMRGLTDDTDVLVDAESEEHGVVRQALSEVEIHLTHDAAETPYIVLIAEDTTEGWS